MNQQPNEETQDKAWGKGMKLPGPLSAHHSLPISTCSPPRSSLNPVLWGFYESFITQKTDDCLNLQSLSAGQKQTVDPTATLAETPKDRGPWTGKRKIKYLFP